MAGISKVVIRVFLLALLVQCLVLAGIHIAGIRNSPGVKIQGDAMNLQERLPATFRTPAGLAEATNWVADARAAASVGVAANVTSRGVNMTWGGDVPRPPPSERAAGSAQHLTGAGLRPDQLPLLQETRLCGGAFLGVGGLFARLRNVAVMPSGIIGKGNSRGGEDLRAVENQPEDLEYFSFESPTFLLPCENSNTSRIHYEFSRGRRNHLTSYLGATKLLGHNGSVPVLHADIAHPVLAVTRYEYVNLYHSMTDFYNAFIVCRLLRYDPNHVQVLFLDAHPMGGLDNTWAALFRGGPPLRVPDLDRAARAQGESGRGPVVRLRELAWGMQSYTSDLENHRRPSLPLVDDFRAFFLRQHGLDPAWAPASRARTCKTLRLLFLWRHDYVAHPRNPTGHVTRKVANEAELVEAVRREWPGWSVRGVQLDSLRSVADQLAAILDTDLLVGMHGAGLSHTLFLRPGSGLVELYPTYWGTANTHFRAMARWRGLHYAQWQNKNPSLEMSGHYTQVPPNVVINLLETITKKMGCNV